MMSVAWTDPLTVIGYDESASNDAKLEGPGRGIWPHAMLRMVSTSVGIDKHGKGTHSLRKAGMGGGGEAWRALPR